MRLDELSSFISLILLLFRSKKSYYSIFSCSFWSIIFFNFFLDSLCLKNLCIFKTAIFLTQLVRS